jgi:exopolysaccharide biosynthesis polyprenyl glycosylphosphotransferase
VFREYRRKVRILFGLADFVLLALAFEFAYSIRSRLELAHNFYILRPVVALLLGFAGLVWAGLASWWEIYDHIDTAHPRVILRDAFRQCLVGTASLVLFEYLGRLDLSRSFVALFAGFTWVLICLFRLNAGRLMGAMRREFSAPRYVMVVGLGHAARRIGQQLEDASAYGVRLIGFLSDGTDGAVSAGASQAAAAMPPEVRLERSYPVHPLSGLPDLLRSHVIDEIIFAVADSGKLAGLEEIFLMCDEEGVRTRVAVDFFPHVNSRIDLDRLGASALLTFSAAPHDEIRLLIKRCSDLLLAAAALLLLFPVMLMIGLIIKLTSPGPAIFRQERCGLNGRRFMFYKFRSMCEDAETQRASLEHLSQRQLALKIPNDPRLTTVGRWLRKFSIDEWPQLWNVLKGDMSLVGPRPAIPEEVEQYERWQRRRLRMRPGLTCVWAVSGRDNVDFETWMRMDMQYIDNWSLALDWKILLLTIPQVLSGRGAN